MKRLLMATVLILGLACIGPCVLADTVYTYTGNYFTDFLGSGFSTSDRVTASFTTASPLNTPTLTDVASLVTAFTISDGVSTFTNLDPLHTLLFNISTDSHGAVTNWAFDTLPNAAVGDPTHIIFSHNAAGLTVMDAGLTGTCADIHCATVSVSSLGDVVDQPGLWEVRTTPVPECASITLLCTGLLGLVSVIRRKIH